MLLAPEEIPKGVGVEVEDTGMDEDAEGAVEGLGSRQRNTMAWCKGWSILHVKCPTVVLCNDLFVELQIVVHGYQKMTPGFSCFPLVGCSSMKTPLQL